MDKTEQVKIFKQIFERDFPNQETWSIDLILGNLTGKQLNTFQSFLDEMAGCGIIIWDNKTKIEYTNEGQQ